MAEINNDARSNGFEVKYANGDVPSDIPNGETFLFTSESVGEGHPGKIKYRSIRG